MSDDRPLGAAHVAAVVIGAMVGVGIFFTPATVAHAVPNAGWMLGIWLLGGLASLAGALVFADLGRRWPRAGGVYVFLREGFPPKLGSALSFLYGWQQLLVVQPGAMAVIALVLVDHLAFVTGPMPPWLRSTGACGAIALFTCANLLGLHVGGRIQIAMAALKLTALAGLVAAGAIFGHRASLVGGDGGASASSSLPTWILFGLIPVLFTFGGAYHATFIAGSVKNPERELPRGIIFGIVVVLVGYLAVNVAYLALLGHADLAASASPAADAVRLVLGPLAGKVLAVVIVVSAAGILNTVSLGFPFVIYAMAKDGVFFQAAAKLDPRTGRPNLAVTLQGGLACAAVVVGASRVDVLLTGIAFADAIFQAAIAVVHLRIVRTAAYAAWTFLVVEAGVALGSLIRAPAQSAYGAVVLLVGALIWRSSWTSR